MLGTFQKRARAEECVFGRARASSNSKCCLNLLLKSERPYDLDNDVLFCVRIKEFSKYPFKNIACFGIIEGRGRACAEKVLSHYSLGHCYFSCLMLT